MDRRHSIPCQGRRSPQKREGSGKRRPPVRREGSTPPEGRVEGRPEPAGSAVGIRQPGKDRVRRGGGGKSPEQGDSQGQRRWVIHGGIGFRQLDGRPEAAGGFPEGRLFFRHGILPGSPVAGTGLFFFRRCFYPARAAPFFTSKRRDAEERFAGRR
jgi:hypothetical protein